MKITDGKTEASITKQGKHWKVECDDYVFLCETRAQAIEKALVFVSLPATITN